jgi:hypothetical protein
MAYMSSRCVAEREFIFDLITSTAELVGIERPKCLGKCCGTGRVNPRIDGRSWESNVANRTFKVVCWFLDSRN